MISPHSISSEVVFKSSEILFFSKKGNWGKLWKDFDKWQTIRFQRGYGTYSWQWEHEVFLKKIQQLVNKQIKENYEWRGTNQTQDIVKTLGGTQ